MLKLRVNKLFELLASDATCECCGTPCKTALCSSCREHLVGMMDDSSHIKTDDLTPHTMASQANA